MPERAAGARGARGQLFVVDPAHVLDVRRGGSTERALELAAADDPEAELGREPRRFEDRLEPVQRDQLADEEAP